MVASLCKARLAGNRPPATDCQLPFGYSIPTKNLFDCNFKVSMKNKKSASHSSNILYVSVDFFKQNAISIRSNALVKALVEAQFRVDVLTYCRHKHLGNSYSEKAHFIRAISIHFGKHKAARFFSEIINGIFLSICIASKRKNYSLVILSSPPFFTNAICSRFCRLCKIPYLLDIRDRYPQVLVDLEILDCNSKLYRLFRYMERKLYEEASMLVCVTSKQAKNIQIDYRINPILVRNGFDERLFSKKSVTTIFQEESPSPLTMRIVCHGLFGELFDEISFLELVQKCVVRVPSVRFVLVGYGPKLKLLGKLCLHNVEIYGHMSQESVIRLLQKCHIGLSMHTEKSHEVFPVKIYEFIGASLPCIIFPRNDAGIEVESKNLGWAFNRSSIDKCVALIHQVSQNPDKSLEPHLTSLKKHRDAYSRQRQVLRFVQLVRELKGG